MKKILDKVSEFFILLDTQAQEILDCLAEQQAQVNSVPEQNGPVLGGMSL